MTPDCPDTGRLLVKYRAHKAGTVGRVDKVGNKIEMRMTFDEWLDVWEESGKLSQRGVSNTSYVMCRKGDIGHYEVGNVFIASNLDNILDAHGKLDDYAKHINEICLRTGYKRRIVRGLIKRGRISVGSDGSVTVHCGSSESPSLTQTEQTSALLVAS